MPGSYSQQVYLVFSFDSKVFGIGELNYIAIRVLEYHFYLRGQLQFHETGVFFFDTILVPEGRFAITSEKYQSYYYASKYYR